MARPGHKSKHQWFHCPHCGEEVRLSAKACPNCGSDQETGWRDHTDESLASDSDEDFNYDEYLAREFPDQYQPKAQVKKFLIWLLLALALAGIVASTFNIL